MKIIYENENSSMGMVVVQSDPQRRTVWANGGKTVNFPYLVQIITYDKVAGGKFSYGGIYKTGLIVLFSNKPIESLEDDVYVCPTELGRHGLVCTPHQYDNKTFDTVESLILFVTGLWWQIEHYHLYASGDPTATSKWQRATTDEVLEIVWGQPISLLSAISADYPRCAGYGRTDGVKADKKKALVSKPIEFKLEIKL